MQERETVVELLETLYIQNETDMIDEVVDPLAIVDSSLCLSIGQAGMHNVVRMWHAGYENISLTIHDIVGQDDKVFVNWECTGQHEGEFLGIAPTGKKIVYNGFNMYHFVDNKIQRYQSITDLPAMYTQLGVEMPYKNQPIPTKDSHDLIREIQLILGLQSFSRQDIQGLSLYVCQHSVEDAAALLGVSSRHIEKGHSQIKQSLSVISNSHLDDHLKKVGTYHLLQHYGEFLLKRATEVID